MSPRASVTGPFIRMLDASSGVLTQPKGSVPRLSNLLGSKRGALRTCDGSAIVNAFDGAPTLGRGKAMCEMFFEPAGVAPYYLRIMKVLDIPLGAPRNLSATLSSGGSLTSGQAYFYKVTAIDNVGGETTASAEVTATPSAGNLSITLQWNVVPNAVFYNVYRGTATGMEILLVGTGLPVVQPAFGTLTATFIDNGSATEGVTLAVSSFSQEFPFSIDTFACQLTLPFTSTPGANAVYTAGTNTALNGTYTIQGNSSGSSLLLTGANTNGAVSSGGTLNISPAPPTSDTTQQTGLYAMFPGVNGASYTNAGNLVALFPADNRIEGNPGGGGGGGAGGGGTGGGGNQGSTAAGGVNGNVSFIPQMVQFTNQAIIALGNGFPPQIYSDPNGTPTNPAAKVAISSISADAHGLTTIVTATPHGIPTTVNAGVNVLVVIGTPGIHLDGLYTIIEVVNATTLKGQCSVAAQGQSSSSGTLTVTTIPIYSTFVPAYPVWTTAVAYSVNSIITPTVSNGHYYKAVQAGTSGASQPTFPTGTGQRVADGSVIWQEAGLINTAAPPPPAAAHIAVYSGSLWAFNTSVATTATGLDGPSSLRMSDVNNPNSWNPINQAFLDKDDGLDGYGLASFTISAQGIPPEGSLIAFKAYQMYQITGVFGASNFAIQRVLSDMGTIASRTIQFIPGFGLGRLTHLGIAIFDGVNDRIVSEPVRPYLFGDPNDLDTADIISMDQQWMAVSQGSQTGNPPMAIFAIPVGPNSSSNGALTRLLCYDLALKGWAVVDLPFPISTLLQVRTAVSQVVTLMGSFSDGTLQRWQSGDQQWATSAAGSATPASISWSVRLPSTARKEPDGRLYGRRVVISGQIGQGGSTLSITPRVAGNSIYTQVAQMPVSGDFSVQAAIGVLDRLFDANVSGVGQITLDGFDIQVEPKPLGVLAGAIS